MEWTVRSWGLGLDLLVVLDTFQNVYHIHGCVHRVDWGFV